MKKGAERHPLRWLGPLLCLVGLVLIGLWAGRLAMAGLSLRGHLARAQELAWTDLQALDPLSVETLLQEMQADLATLRDEGRVLLWLAPMGSWVPRWGGDLAAAPDLLEMAARSTEAALLAWKSLEPSLALVREGGGHSPGRPLSVALAVELLAARPALRQAQESLRQARAAREHLDPEHLSPALRDLVERLDSLLPLFDHGLTLAQAAPVLLGAEQERNYLLLVQNEDERRATGGFISGYGIITLRGGQVVQSSFDNSYNADDYTRPYPEAPEAMRRLMGIDLWVFRDSNWSPDFPTSARQALRLFRPARAVAIDGVIALDQETLRRLVQTMGPLQVEGQTITAETVVPYIRQVWAPAEGTWTPQEWQQRKEFMGVVATALLGRLQEEGDRVDWLSLAQAAQTLLDEKHLLLYLPQPPEVAAVLAERGWDGALRMCSQDCLQVVDSNVGYNKVNPRILQELVYQVDLTVEPTLVTATLHYTHTGRPEGAPCRPRVYAAPRYEDMMRGCYWDYVRLYAPGGSELRGGRVPAVPAEEVFGGEAIGPWPIGEAPESGRQAFSAVLVMAPGETQVLAFSYVLPGAVRYEEGEWHYRLLLQKQAGTMGPLVRVVLKLPARAEATACRPAPCPGTSPLVFTLRLLHDQEVEVSYRLP